MLRCVPEPAVMAGVISSGSVVRWSIVRSPSSGLFGLRITSLDREEDADDDGEADHQRGEVSLDVAGLQLA